ncbi:unnamed protein product, partial [Closterium sp. NIES-54]
VRCVLIPCIRALRHQLRARFQQDLSVLRLHSIRGGEFSSYLLEKFCHKEGITQSFMLPASPQQNGIAECHIGLIMEVARTSMIHAVAPYFMWPLAVRYAVHQLNLWPRVSQPETSPTVLWMGEVGDASAFRFPCPPPLPLFLVPGPPPVDPLPPTSPAPSERQLANVASRRPASAAPRRPSNNALADDSSAHDCTYFPAYVVGGSAGGSLSCCWFCWGQPELLLVLLGAAYAAAGAAGGSLSYCWCSGGSLCCCWFCRGQPTMLLLVLLGGQPTLARVECGSVQFYEGARGAGVGGARGSGTWGTVAGGAGESGARGTRAGGTGAGGAGGARAGSAGGTGAGGA